LLFNAGSNKQVFSSNPEKKFGTSDLSFSRKAKAKNAHFNSEKWGHRAEGPGPCASTGKALVPSGNSKLTISSLAI